MPLKKHLKENGSVSGRNAIGREEIRNGVKFPGKQNYLHLSKNWVVEKTRKAGSGESGAQCIQQLPEDFSISVHDAKALHPLRRLSVSHWTLLEMG